MRFIRHQGLTYGRGIVVHHVVVRLLWFIMLYGCMKLIMCGKGIVVNYEVKVLGFTMW